MRAYLLAIICLSLTACATTPLPTPEVLYADLHGLAGKQTYRLAYNPPASVADEQLALTVQQPPNEIQRALDTLGYAPSDSPEMLISSTLELNVQPTPVTINNPAPAAVGPDQSVQLLHEVTGTLSMSISTPDGKKLWQGRISTGLSPTRDSAELLEIAVMRLVQQLPAATARTRPIVPQPSLPQP